MVLSSAIHIKLSKTTMDNVYLDTIQSTSSDNAYLAFIIRNLFLNYFLILKL